MTCWATETRAHREAVHASYGVLRRTNRHDLRWVTVIHAAWVVRVGDDIGPIVRAAADLGAEWREVLMRGGRIRRDPRGYTRMSGVIEIDLLHSLLISSPMKKALFAEFGIGVSGLSREDRVLVLHTHVLIDGRGHPSWTALERDLRQQWPGPRRVHLGKIHSEGTVSENVDRLADYSTKFELKYSKGNLDGRRAEYFRIDYEPEWREYIKRLYKAIGFAGLEIATVKSRSSSSRVYGETSEFRGEIEKNAGLQLEHGQEQQEHTREDIGDSDNMNIRDIIPYINLDKITVDTLRDIEDALDRMSSPTPRSEQLQIQYGDEEEEIRIEQARLDLEQTRAEIDRTRAEAVKDLATANADESG